MPRDDWPRTLSPNQHGTAARYNTVGCRCKRCSHANRLYRRGELGYNERAPRERVRARPEDVWPSKAG